MVYSVQQIKFEFLGYIKEFGGKFDDWYVGIAAEPLDAMTGGHGVDRDQDIWIYKQALTFQACRTIQAYFLDKLHTDGEAAARGGEDMDCIYMFKKSERTTP